MKNNILTAEEIKQLVSIEQVLSVYGIEYTGKRIPCPIHNGTDNNFSIIADIWHCFVCDETGDIFSLVQHLNNCDFKQAKDFICDTFNLKREKPREAKKKLLELDEERTYKRNLKKVHNYQHERICQTLHALKGTFAEKHLKDLLERFRKDKDFILYRHDIHAHLITLLQRYGKYKPMIIITDKEKTSPFTFEKEQYQIAFNEVSSLAFGDYSLKGLENEICIITKNLEELITTLEKEKAAYWEQAKRFKFCAFVLECSLLNIGGHEYKQNIKPQFVMEQLNNLAIKYGIHIFYCGSKQAAEYTTYNLLETYLYDKQEQLEKVLCHTRKEQKENAA